MPLRPQDLDRLATPTDPRLHPDGSRVVYALAEVDLEEDRYFTTLQLWDGTSTRRFTHGPSDRMPRWSPDGGHLSFLRKESGDDTHPQVVVMPVEGGEAQRRTGFSLGASDHVWSPDGRRLVVVGSEWSPDLADLDAEERRRRPRRITRLPYRADPDGWLHERRQHLWLVDRAGDGEARCLTPGDHEEHDPTWRADGKRVLFLSGRGELAEDDPRMIPWEVDVKSLEVREVGPPGLWDWVGEDPEGRVHLVGLEGITDWPGVERVWRCEPEGQDWRLTDLTGHLDQSVPALSRSGPIFVDDGFVTGIDGRGRTGVVHVREHGDRVDVEPVLDAGRTITGFDVRGDLSATVFTYSDPATPGELAWLENGRERTVTDLSGAFRADVDVLPTSRFTFQRGDAELDVWATLPDRLDDADKGTVPVLLVIHGGPTAQFTDTFFDEFQVYAGAGYLVVGTNPRGSSGRGTDWARAVVGVWDDPDSVDLLDLRAVVDETLERYPQADPKRIGVMGGSYGGYATARILARDERFASAVVERGLLQWESFAGTSDIGPFFDRMFLDADVRHGAQTHHAASPVQAAGAIRTPTLVLHSEHDWRCPIEQAEQLFVALKRAGVTTEFVRFPDEGHELSRSGAPKHRLERFEILLDWHRRFLRG